LAETVTTTAAYRKPEAVNGSGPIQRGSRRLYHHSSGMCRMRMAQLACPRYALTAVLH
jgi:hypothetical protein